jgi:hypothetical protein
VDLVDLLGACACEQQFGGFGLALAQHAVADEAEGDGGNDRDVVDRLGGAITVASTSSSVLAPRTTSSSITTLAGEKKCLRTLVEAAISSTSR